MNERLKLLAQIELLEELIEHDPNFIMEFMLIMLQERKNKVDLLIGRKK